MSTKFSVYKDFTSQEPSESISIDEYIGRILGGHYRAATLGARAVYKELGKGDDYSDAKKSTPIVTISADFQSRRGNNEPHTHSGLILMDIDDQDNNLDDMEAFPESAEGDPYIYAYHRSIGGQGYAVIFRIPADSSRHLACFLSLENYIKKTYNLKVDPQCKDVARPRFVSYDPDLYVNREAHPWGEGVIDAWLTEENRTYLSRLEKVERMAREYEQNPMATRAGDTSRGALSLERAMVVAGQIAPHLAQVSDRELWMDTGWALANYYGDQGEQVFMRLWEDWYVAQEKEHLMDQDRAKYHNDFVATNRGLVTIGTFIGLATKYNIRVYPTREDRKREDQGKSPDQVLQEIKQEAKDLTDKKGNPRAPSRNDGYRFAQRYVEALGIRYNEVTMYPEVDGNELHERFEAQVLGDLRTVLPYSAVTKTMVEEIIDDIRETYNPLKEYLGEVGNRPSEGLVDELIDCIELRPEVDPKIKKYIRKWLVSFVASVYGNIGDLMLVLQGEGGTGKSTFFEMLLPERLRDKYFANFIFNPRNRDSDFAQASERRWLLLSDELDKLTDVHWSSFKNMVSSDGLEARAAYSKRSRKYKRLAVLAGTTNESLFLADVTGNRRIISVGVTDRDRDTNTGGVDIDRVEAIDKDLLFGELLREYTADPEWSWRPNPHKGEMLEINILSEGNRRKFNDEYLVSEFFEPVDKDTQGEDVYLLPTTMVATILRALDPSGRGYQIATVGTMLKRMGFAKVQRRVGGKPTWGYLMKNTSGMTLQQACSKNGIDLFSYVQMDSSDQTPSGNDPFSA